MLDVVVCFFWAYHAIWVRAVVNNLIHINISVFFFKKKDHLDNADHQTCVFIGFVRLTGYQIHFHLDLVPRCFLLHSRSQQLLSLDTSHLYNEKILEFPLFVGNQSKIIFCCKT